MPDGFRGAIFEVDGVVVGSPHERAWRGALRELMSGEWRGLRHQTSYAPERFTPGFYQHVIAGRARPAGARAALEYFEVPKARHRAGRYAAVTQEHAVRLTREGRFAAFVDALRFVLAVEQTGIEVAAVSSSQSARAFLDQIRLDTFAAEQRLDYPFISSGLTLLRLFDAVLDGGDLPHADPGPGTLLAAAAELGIDPPGRCLVVAAATAGIEAARAAGMAVLGVARQGDEDALLGAGADLVVSTLDDVSVDALAEGRLQMRSAFAERRRRQREHPPGTWSLTYDGFDAERQGLREALCALGNGFFVTRGAFPEAHADGVSYPGTYVAGLYDRVRTSVAGRTLENEDLVNAPNWLPLRFRLDGAEWFDIQGGDVLDHRLTLDIRRGMLIRHLRWQEPDGRRTSLLQRRFVSMKDAHLAGLETTFTAENWAGKLEVWSGLDGRIVNSGVRRYRELNGSHLDVLHAAEADAQTIELQAETTQSRIRIAVAARTSLLVDGQQAAAERHLITEPGTVTHALTLTLEQGQAVTVEKIAALYTSRDRAISESLLEARHAAVSAPGFAEVGARHAAGWELLWNRFGIRLDTADEWAETVLHLHILHLLQTVSPNSIVLDVGVPARGWHGEAYRGHVFWDEMFIFPLLNFQLPTLAAALLGYRHQRLGAARAAATAAGYQGAMFPWQSGSNGREETQQLHLNPQSGRWLPDHSHLQRHVGIAVAYNTWQHYLATGSISFLRFTGAEMLIEIARFWASIASYNPQLGRYEILGVMGPDEYHDQYPGAARPGVDNNTYTNVMAVWVLDRAIQALDELPPYYRHEVITGLRLGAGELDRWRDITTKMRVVFHDDGVLAQFEGYDRLQEFDWEGYRARYGNIQRLDRLLEAEGDSTNRYKLSKQADVLMLLFLLSPAELREILRGLGYEVTQDQLARTVHYHLERTAEGSSLSRVVHAWVLARLDPAHGWRFIHEALESDIADVQGGTTAEGIHLAAMAGTVDIVLRCLTGMRPSGEVLHFDPVLLPPEIRSISFSVHHREHRVGITLTGDQLSVSARPGDRSPIKIGVGDDVRELAPGGQAIFRLGREWHVRGAHHE
jgi:trehalose/maltose hydrolase-like predicted phosphorylase/beta-phosphoglucomutase-like phosphatase (HAD superfamily)